MLSFPRLAFSLRSAGIAALFGLTAATVASGCSEDEPDESTGPTSLDALTERLGEARCEFLVRCTWLPDANTCKQTLSVDRTLVQLVHDAKDKTRVEFDPVAGGDWIDVVRFSPCQDTFATQRELEDAWDAVWTGKVKSGGACLVDEHCEGDLGCNRDCGGGCCEGVCESVPGLVEIGGDCSDRDCVDAAYCDQDGDTGMSTCVERAGNAQACDGFGTCQDGQECDAQGGDNCYQLATRGSQCNPLLTRACLDYDTHCDPDQEKCVTAPGPGEPCATNGEGCVRYARCNEDDNTCEALGTVGGGCGGDRDCLPDLRCADGQCQVRDVPEPCMDEPPA